MDKAGRLVIPKEIRNEANLQPNVPLEIRVEADKVVIEIPHSEPLIEYRHGIPVLVFPEGTPKFTSDDVLKARNRLERERFQRHGEPER